MEDDKSGDIAMKDDTTTTTIINNNNDNEDDKNDDTAIADTITTTTTNTVNNNNNINLQELKFEKLKQRETSWYKPLTIFILVLDFTTGILGLITWFQTKGNYDCCGEDTVLGTTKPTIVTYMILALLVLCFVEIYPLLYKYWTISTIFNAWLGFAITIGISIGPVNDEMCIIMLGLQILSVLFQWYTFSYLQDKRLFCSIHFVAILPMTIAVGMIIMNYLRDGDCIVIVDDEENDDNLSLATTTKQLWDILWRSIGNNDACSICQESGNPPWLDGASTAVTETFCAHAMGTYCSFTNNSTTTGFCWHPSS